MLRRPWWLVGWLLCLGCHSLVGLEMGTDPGPAEQLWKQGQAALAQGQPERAIGFYEQSLGTDPSLTRNHMSLAAAYLESGNEEAACVHLAKYVEAHPEHMTVRGHYAELLLRLKRPAEAREEFVRFIADAQEFGDDAQAELINSHSRLMEIAESAEDDYSDHLHRGIGLYLLARQRAGLEDPEGELPAEGLLCKAASELTMARTLRPDEAQPCWYLHAVWSRLGQTLPARRWLHEAEAAAPFSYLTPAEQRSLVLASRAQQAQEPRR